MEVNALATYKKALETMSAKKVSSGRTSADDDVMFMRSYNGVKHQEACELEPPTFGKKKPKTSGVTIPEGGPSDITRSLQAAPFHGADDVEEKEFRNLKQKVKAHDEAMLLMAAANTTLRQEFKDLPEEMVNLRVAAENISDEMVMAINDVKILVRWKLIRVWLRHLTNSWRSEIFELAFQCHRFEVNQHPVAEVSPVLLRSGQSVPRERAVDGTNGMLIDGATLPSINGDVRMWAEHIL
ncbi:hypothetical protein F2Q68_00031536 [Brassica cretica]|uniref:Uncharacterized protein n=1 Tax=Brassica cretica TaxID=69181 RepID=A0A8S9G9D7_BRACR|nr:hypothetical protein F2Q68_00031536 [Brassica cretica]